MSEKRFNRITDAEIKAKGVQSLAIRPNMPSQYGQGGLNGRQLQERFDRLAGYIIEKYNILVDALASHEVLDYFKLPEGYTLPTLRSLLSRVTDETGDLIVESPYIEGKERLADIVAKIRTDIDDLYVSLGSCGGILDVVSLPGENIALNSLYRVGETLYYWYDGYWHTVVNDHMLLQEVSTEAARAIDAENVLTGRLDIIEPLAKGATQAISRTDYKSCISEINNAPAQKFPIGQSIMIGTLNVPDLWVSGNSYYDQVPYTYTSDEDFVNELKKNGYVRIGHYTVSALETQKVDLSEYVQAYVGKNLTIKNSFDTENSIAYARESGENEYGMAYLSSDIALTKEQLIGASYVSRYLYYDSWSNGTITDSMITEETADGLCVKITDSEYECKMIFCAYTENYKPRFVSKPFPKVGTYLGVWADYDSPYIDTLDATLIPTKYINNALIDIKNHPDFIAPDFPQYVKKTNYATDTSGGVVKVGATTPFVTTDGYLKVYTPTDSEFSRRDTAKGLIRVVNLSVVDKVIKYGLTTNKLTLTEAEKTAAAKWLGLPRTYADLPDKPFGTLSSININSNNSGISYALTNGRAYKQTGIAFSPNDLIGATVEYYDGSSYTSTKTLASSHLVEDTPQGATFKVVNNVYIIICRSASGYKPSGIGVDTITEVGTYYSYYDDGDPYEVTSLQKDGEVVIPIEEKYIPDTIARTEYVDEAIANIEIPEGSGGSAIIDVVELPTENINEKAFYRVVTGGMAQNKMKRDDLFTCYCVEELPEIGVPASNPDMSSFCVYYNVTDQILYAYVDDLLSQYFSIPIGWYPAEMLLSAIGATYGGVITNLSDCPMDDKFYLLLEYKIWQYADGWTGLTPIGWAGIGSEAEVFNSPLNKASGRASHAEGRNTTASGDYSHAEGYNTTASGDYSHVEGYNSTASGDYSHAEGLSTDAIGNYSHAEGGNSTASGEDSHAEGTGTTARGGASHAEGYNTIASGGASHAEGRNTTSNGYCSHAEGIGTVADGEASHAQGKFNIADTEGKYTHIVGNGTDRTHSNAHTLDWSGNAVFAGAVSGTGADYAEHFEWLDGNPNNEDRVGTIVTLEGDKIRVANAGDEMLGIVSGTAMVIGDNAEWEWRGKYITDHYGRYITEMVEEFIEVTNPETKEKEQKSVGFFPHRKLNPEWDAAQEYTRRSDRREWDVIGLFGKLYVNDDGSCVVGGYATNGNNGKATASILKTNMRVMKRITSNIVLVFMK